MCDTYIGSSRRYKKKKKYRKLNYRKELTKGYKTERKEHKWAGKKAWKIARDHLKERKDYYRVIKKCNL